MPIWNRKIKNNLNTLIIYISVLLLLNACNTVPVVVRGPPPQPVTLPFLRLEQAGECYYIDDFLPTPDSLVNGKTSNLYLRYYTYWNARYKYWSEVGIMLAFYSKDLRCWALFEEYALPRIEEK
ncbi:hypothetical protein [Fluviispira sanaruensis]|uniref:Uncharacterized protein n=1 Tax=Fluviispira sanaruensis TaxID=2493639 RepID=A0A4P2VGF3_FLUSA|nr:hypothetical protein [Fluviispira sanaruensis]BBH51943.1 hypothetical protein JCM31447_03720 [Fluviispira sanaruensis]